MQVTACGSRSVVQLASAGVRCVRTLASSAGASRAGLSRQSAVSTLQLGSSSFLGQQCAQLAGGARRAAQQQPGSRGFRSSSTIMMGLKTGIVGLPNVGKVRKPAGGAGWWCHPALLPCILWWRRCGSLCCLCACLSLLPYWDAGQLEYSQSQTLAGCSTTTPPPPTTPP